jgi:hypothetical protein
VERGLGLRGPSFLGMRFESGCRECSAPLPAGTLLEKPKLPSYREVLDGGFCRLYVLPGRLWKMNLKQVQSFKSSVVPICFCILQVTKLGVL